MSAPAPPLFHYCANHSTLDIVFPNWTFWGSPEINVKPWEPLKRELKEGNERVRWMDREPYAYWKGNPWVSAARKDLLKCNVSKAHDWNARIYNLAQAIRKEANNFIQEKLKIKYVYDYMLHLLTEYSKLLRCKPTRPRKAIELCSEYMACPSKGLQKKFMMESMVMSPHDSAPCKLPPPLEPVELKMLEKRKAIAIKQVEMWEQKAQNS